MSSEENDQHARAAAAGSAAVPASPAEGDGDPAADDALVAVLLEIERHVGAAGWDQPARLFALVRTSELMAAEPGLAGELADVSGVRPEDALSAIEQDHFSPGPDLVAELSAISWPAEVWGCALAQERTFLPADADVDLPDDADAAAAVVADHPRRQELRIVAGVDRSGAQHGLGRLRSSPEELLGSATLVPGLTQILAHTLV